MVGTIMKGIGGFYYVKASDSIYECKAGEVKKKIPELQKKVQAELAEIDKIRDNLS